MEIVENKAVCDVCTHLRIKIFLKKILYDGKYCLTKNIYIYEAFNWELFKNCEEMSPSYF